eukprot:6198725-Pleurochrysis_carterae.AAC.1
MDEREGRWECDVALNRKRKQEHVGVRVLRFMGARMRAQLDCALECAHVGARERRSASAAAAASASRHARTRARARESERARTRSRACERARATARAPECA